MRGSRHPCIQFFLLAISALIQSPANAEGFKLQSWLDLSNWIDLGLSYNTQPMMVLSGGKNQSAKSFFQTIVLDLGVSTGMNKSTADWLESDHWAIHLELTQLNGDLNFQQEIGALFEPQSTANPVGTWLTEAHISREPGESWWSMQAGIMSINNKFLAIDAYDFYNTSTINNNYNVNNTGFPINPIATTAVQFALHDKKWGELRYGFFDLDRESAVSTWLGVELPQPRLKGNYQGLQWTVGLQQKWAELQDEIEIGESSTTPRLLPSPSGQLGGYIANVNIEGDNMVKLKNANGLTRGIYLAATMATNLPIGLDNRLWGAGAFTIEGKSPTPTYIAAGLLSQGALLGREKDVLALGFTRTSLASSKGYSPPFLNYEAIIELNYTIQFNQNLQIQPQFQWIINPGGGNGGQGGNANTPGIWAAGLTLNLEV